MGGATFKTQIMVWRVINLFMITCEENGDLFMYIVYKTTYTGLLIYF